MIEKDYLISAFDGLGFLYGQITYYLGFTPHKHEGKVTGLAAYGYWKKTIKVFQNIVSFKNGKIKCRLVPEPFYTNLSKILLKNLKIQKRYCGRPSKTLRLIVKWVKYWLKKNKGFNNICLAGGVFGNVKINQVIAELRVKMYIFFHIADGGIPYGSASLGYFLKTGVSKVKFENMYSGLKFSIKKF